MFVASVRVSCAGRTIRCDRVRIHRNLFVAVLVHVTILLVKNIDQLIALSDADNNSSQDGYQSLGETVRRNIVTGRCNYKKSIIVINYLIIISASEATALWRSKNVLLLLLFSSSSSSSLLNSLSSSGCASEWSLAVAWSLACLRAEVNPRSC